MGDGEGGERASALGTLKGQMVTARVTEEQTTLLATEQEISRDREVEAGRRASACSAAEEEEEEEEESS